MYRFEDVSSSQIDSGGTLKFKGDVRLIGGYESLDHRRDVLIRRTNFRLDKIEKRLEILGGYLIAYLNLDEVIRIIRFEDEPKKKLIKAFELTETQAEVLTWIAEFIETSGYPPSYRNIMEAFGWTSPNAVAGHLHKLEQKKRIRIIPTISRGIIVLRKD